MQLTVICVRTHSPSHNLTVSITHLARTYMDMGGSCFDLRLPYMRCIAFVLYPMPREKQSCPMLIVVRGMRVCDIRFSRLAGVRQASQSYVCTHTQHANPETSTQQGKPLSFPPLQPSAQPKAKIGAVKIFLIAGL